MDKTPFSRLIAGTMTWGVWGKDLTKIQMTERIEACVAHKITAFDHADIYGDYTTEAAFGKAFRESQVARSDVQFISKCGIQLPLATRGNTIKHYTYAANYMIASVEQSLRNLQTEYLDLLLLHRPSPLLQVEEVATAVNKLTREGKIVEVGLSNFDPAQTALLQTVIDVRYNQIEFSLTAYEAMINGHLSYMQVHTITPMCWSPLGTVFSKNDPRSQRVATLAQQLADTYTVSVEVILLAWIIKHPAGILPVFGSTNLQRIANLYQATTLELTEQDWFALWTASAGTAVP